MSWDYLDPYSQPCSDDPSTWPHMADVCRHCGKRKHEHFDFGRGLDCPKPMAFTIGHKKSYDKGLREATGAKPLLKKGRTPDYGGGIVWQTEREAKAFIKRGEIITDGRERDPATFTVYGLFLPNGWDKDVSKDKDPDDGAYRLLTDAPILALGDP